MANITFKIDGQTFNAPVEWQDIQVLATFDNDAVQANISTEKFTFVNEAAKYIRDWIDGGLSGSTPGIFEGIPFEIIVSDSNATFTAFKGFLNFERDYVEESPVKVSMRIKKEDGLNSLFDRSQATTYGFLENQGAIGPSDYIDIDYVVEDTINIVELIITSVAIFLLAKELAESIRRITEYIVTIVSIANSATPPSTGIVGALLYAVGALILEIIYAAIITVQLIQLTQTMIEQFISPIRQHKATTLHTLLEKAFAHFGYGFQTGITQLSQIAYLPSSPVEDRPLTSGIPKAADFGYRVSELIELVKRLYNTKIAIIGGDVHVRTESDPFWIQTANYTFPDVLLESVQYNTEEFDANTLIAFETDTQDNWTVYEFDGVNAEAIRTPNVVNNQKNLLFNGLEEIQIPCALGSRKSELNDLETALLAVAQATDSVVNFLGGNSNLSALIENRVGMLKVSQPAHSVPKLLNQINGALPVNHRDNFRALTLYNDFHSFKSFAGPDFSGQKRVFNQVRIPFGFSDFQELIDNSYFTTQTGQSGKIVSLKWNFDGDFALVDFWIREKYTDNIQETVIEG